MGWFLIVLDVATIADDAPLANRLAFLGVAKLLGGVTLPVSTPAVSLAFARAEAQPPVRIATTLLLANSAGAVVGPMIVAALLPAIGWAALPWVIIATSALMTLFALARRVAVGAHGHAATPMVEVPASSVVITESAADVQAEATAQAEAAA